MSSPIKASVLHHIQRAALILMAGTLLGNGISFLKSLLVAMYYGTSAGLDAYFLSLAPFRLLSGVLIGAIQVTLIPRFLELKEQRSETYAFTIFGTSILAMIVVVTLIGIVFWIGSPCIASYLGVGFEQELVEFTAFLLQVSSILLFLTIFNQMLISLFHAYRQFLFPAFLPLIGGICSMGYIVYFRSQGVPSLMYGLLVGAFVQTLIIFLGIRRLCPQQLSLVSLRHPEIRCTGALMLPLLLGACFAHTNMVIDQMMASTLPAGSIAALHYATKLHSVLTQVFIMMVSKAIFPFLAQQAAQGDRDAMKQTFVLTIKRTLFILLPISLLILGSGQGIVRLLFQRGAFDSYSTSATAGAWIAYSVGLPVQAIGILTARMYNALQENKTLMYVSAIGILLNIVFNVVFMKVWGHVGIAASTSAVYYVTTIILLTILRKRIGRLHAYKHS